MCARGFLAAPADLVVLREAGLEMAGRGIRGERGGKRGRSSTLNVDSLSIEAHGRQRQSEWNGHYAAGKKAEIGDTARRCQPCNEVRFLISLLAFEVMHVACRAITRITGTGWVGARVGCASVSCAPRPGAQLPPLHRG